jgi:hypothetical protein
MQMLNLCLWNSLTTTPKMNYRQSNNEIMEVFCSVRSSVFAAPKVYRDQLRRSYLTRRTNYIVSALSNFQVTPDGAFFGTPNFSINRKLLPELLVFSIVNPLSVTGLRNAEAPRHQSLRQLTESEGRAIAYETPLNCGLLCHSQFNNPIA